MIAGAAEDGQQQRHSTNTTKGRFLMLATQFPYEAINLPTPIALLSCNSSLSWSSRHAPSSLATLRLCEKPPCATLTSPFVPSVCFVVPPSR
jgi:hypothetical protein